MTSQVILQTPGLSSYVKSLRVHPADTSAEHLMSLLKRRQIHGSRPCALATTHLLLRVIAESKHKNVTQLLDRIRGIGRRLIDAQPREMVVGNIVRRVLGLVREVTEAPLEKEGDAGFGRPVGIAHNDLMSPLTNDETMPDHDATAEPLSMREVKEDVLNGLREMLDELDQADEQIAGYALEHIHANEVILTYTSSLTVQRFLLSAAKRRKFTVIHVEGYPNAHEATYDTIMNGRKKEDDEDKDGDNRYKPLTAAGITVTMVPDSAVFAIMARVHKVILPAHIVVSNGGFTAAAGSWTIARAAKAHHVPLIALGAVYKLSPLHPGNTSELTELGDAGKVISFGRGDFVHNIDVLNPVLDYVPPDLTDLVVTNIGAFAPSFIYQIVKDHYRDVDRDLTTK